MTTNTKSSEKADSNAKDKQSATAKPNVATGSPDVLTMTIPTGRIQEKVLDILSRIGLDFSKSGRSYKPVVSANGIQAKMLKGQNIPELVALGRHDCGFSGYDWIVERNAEVVELLDLGFDPVKIVAAVPEELEDQQANGFRDLGRPVVIASEYRNLTESYARKNGLNSIFLQTFGATEALPPEDADMIVDNTATGTTLKHNRLVIIDELLRSTTRFFCNKAVLDNPEKRRVLEELTMLMKSTLQARERVLLEMNVDTADFDNLVKNLPCMRAPTISELYNGQGYAIKIAVLSYSVKELIPQLVALGAKDILEYKLEKIVS